MRRDSPYMVPHPGCPVDYLASRGAPLSEAMDAASPTYADRFEAIVAIAADAIISVDEQQRITLFNKGAEEIFGYTAQEILGTSLDTLIPERFRPNHGGHIRRFAESGMAARRMGERREIFGLRKDGTEFPAEASISKIETGGRMLFTVVLRDITERKQAEEGERFLAETAAELAVTLDTGTAVQTIADL